MHRIASALEHQLNLSFPAVQPGTEEPGDLAYLQQPVAPRNADTSSVATPSTAAAATQSPETPLPAVQQASVPLPVPREPPAEGQRAGVNSMFGL